jgi:hypothetical protein
MFISDIHALSANRDLSDYSNVDLSGLMGLINDEKRGNWTQDLVALQPDLE